MTHPQVFGQNFTPIRGFSAWKTHPFWPHIPNVTQYGSAPRAQARAVQRRSGFVLPSTDRVTRLVNR